MGAQNKARPFPTSISWKPARELNECEGLRSSRSSTIGNSSVPVKSSPHQDQRPAGWTSTVLEGGIKHLHPKNPIKPPGARDREFVTPLHFVPSRSA